MCFDPEKVRGFFYSALQCSIFQLHGATVPRGTRDSIPGGSVTASGFAPALGAPSRYNSVSTSPSSHHGKKISVLLFVLAVAAAAMFSAVVATSTSRQASRSRFLLAKGNVYESPLPPYACSKKSAAVCLAPGSPGSTCCDGRCVDTVASADHCGGCNKVCKHGRVCCGGRCVDLLKDKRNCGQCFNRCNKKCSYGFCDYAQ